MLKLEEYDVEPLLHREPVSDPQVSPDGSRVLYVLSQVHPDDERSESHIWMIPVEGGEPRQFTSCNGNDSSPRWSPEGEVIYFLSTRLASGEREEKRNRLWAIPAGGGEARLIAETENSIMEPKVSPDGGRILFLSRIDEDSEVPENPLEDALWITKLRYKMNGQPFFPYTRTQLFVVDAGGGEPRQLTSGPYDVSSPDWSPDGSEIVFLANKEEGDYNRIRDIYVISSDGETLRKVTEQKDLISSVAWSPGGGYLAYGGRLPKDPKYPGYGINDVWIISTKGGKARNLSADFDRTTGAYGSNVVWGGDRAIYIRAPDRGSWNVYRVGADGGGVEAVIEGKQTVGAFSLSQDASVIVYTATNMTWPLEVYVKNESGTRRLTNVNAELMEKWRISKPEEFWFTASDGVKVHGWMVKPRDYEEGKRYPLILKIHGGPHSQFCYRLGTMEHDAQILARHGYAVIYTNPRDSIGYGDEFSSMAEGAWGGRDYQDLMEAVDHTLETFPFVDPERLGVTGGSFGGFMTNWVISHTDRFKAAVTTMSVCNWISQIGVGDVSWGHSGVGSEREPWEVPDRYMEMSPLTYVADIKTPVLIMAGEKDLRCPVSQSDQLFYALKRLKREVEYIRFAGEPHGIVKPSNRVYRSRHIVRWFERYLK
jgi:acylaminoacyl-peptidase